MGVIDDDGVDLRSATGRHLLRIPQIHGLWIDSGRRQELILAIVRGLQRQRGNPYEAVKLRALRRRGTERLAFQGFALHLQREPFFLGFGKILFHFRQESADLVKAHAVTRIEVRFG